jgi:hydantoinase/carbamoylase family amidase
MNTGIEGATTTGPTGAAGFVVAERVANDLAALAGIGALDGGGITRLAFSDEDRVARAYIMEQMERAGLTVRVDAAGNIFGRREGRSPGAPAVLSGSHLDTVPRGGSLDGALGVVAALEAARAVGLAGLELARPLEVVVFTDEEGVRFNNFGLTGSRALLGTLDIDELEASHDSEGTSVATAMRRWGLDPARVHEARRDGSTIHAFVELHIEQGAVLDAAHLPVGVVTGIAAPANVTLRLSGVADHAGATPMDLRHDALTGAAEVILAAERIARHEVGPPAVATVGQLDVVPGASNVIPGQVTLVVDVRHVSASERDRAITRIEQEAARIAQRRNLRAETVGLTRVEPAELSPAVVETIEAACIALDVPHMRLPSGAAHDAMNVRRIAPTGMIFVPSVQGRSHCPEELTRVEDIVAGVCVLAETLARLGGVGRDGA